MAKNMAKGKKNVEKKVGKTEKKSKKTQKDIEEEEIKPKNQTKINKKTKVSKKKAEESEPEISESENEDNETEEIEMKSESIESNEIDESNEVEENNNDEINEESVEEEKTIEKEESSEDQEENDEDQEESDEVIQPKEPQKIKKKADSRVEQEDGNPPSTRVYISNLSRSTTKEKLTEFFNNQGFETSDVFVPTNNNKNKGFAFAEFKDLENSAEALDLSGTDLDGQNIEITYAKPRKDRDDGNSRSFSKFGGGRGDPTNIIFVKNLAPNITEETLESKFSGAKEIRLMKNQDGSCRGHAYIEYDDLKEAKQAKEKMSGAKINGFEIILDFAQPRSNDGRFSRGGRGNFNRGSGGNRFQRDGNSRNQSGYGGGFRGGRDGGRGGGRGGRDNFAGKSRGGYRGGFGGGQRGQKIQFNEDDD